MEVAKNCGYLILFVQANRDGSSEKEEAKFNCCHRNRAQRGRFDCAVERIELDLMNIFDKMKVRN